MKCRSIRLVRLSTGPISPSAFGYGFLICFSLRTNEGRLRKIRLRLTLYAISIPMNAFGSQLRWKLRDTSWFHRPSVIRFYSFMLHVHVVTLPAPFTDFWRWANFNPRADWTSRSVPPSTPSVYSHKPSRRDIRCDAGIFATAVLLSLGFHIFIWRKGGSWRSPKPVGSVWPAVVVRVGVLAFHSGGNGAENCVILEGLLDAGGKGLKERESGGASPGRAAPLGDLTMRGARDSRNGGYVCIA